MTYIIKVESLLYKNEKIQTKTKWYRCNTKWKADRFKQNSRNSSVITIMTVHEFVNGLKNITNLDDLDLLD